MLKQFIRSKVPGIVPFIGPVYVALRDWRLRFLTWRPRYDQPGLITEASCQFMQDEDYLMARDHAIYTCKQTPPRGGDWRLYVAAWAARHALHIEGNYVECGVDRGLTSRLAYNYANLENANKHFYLVDSFGEMSGYSDTYEIVRKAFEFIDKVHVIRGRVPEVLPEIPSQKFAYVHIDMNDPVPEVAAAEYFWDKLSPGGVMFFCDYGVVGREDQRDALDAWAKTKKDVNILSLPTTQGIIIKP